MIIRNKIDKPFGPFGTSTGYFLLAGGILATWYSLTGLILAIIGAFIAFTTTSTFIDTDKKRIRFSNDLFGIFPAGKWIELSSGMKLVIRKTHRGFRAYTRANQPTDIHYNDFRIFLFSRVNKQLGTVERFNSLHQATEALGRIKEMTRLDS